MLMRPQEQACLTEAQISDLINTQKVYLSYMHKLLLQRQILWKISAASV